MTNRDRLKHLLMDVFLLEEDEFSFELMRDEIETWDSLGTVSLAVGVQETLGYHMTPEEATSMASVKQIMDLLQEKGVNLEE